MGNDICCTNNTEQDEIDAIKPEKNLIDNKSIEKNQISLKINLESNKINPHKEEEDININNNIIDNNELINEKSDNLNNKLQITLTSPYKNNNLINNNNRYRETISDDEDSPHDEDFNKKQILNNDINNNQKVERENEKKNKKIKNKSKNKYKKRKISKKKNKSYKNQVSKSTFISDENEYIINQPLNDKDIISSNHTEILPNFNLPDSQSNLNYTSSYDINNHNKSNNLNNYNNSIISINNIYNQNMNIKENPIPLFNNNINNQFINSNITPNNNILKNNEIYQNNNNIPNDNDIQYQNRNNIDNYIQNNSLNNNINNIIEGKDFIQKANDIIQEYNNMNNHNNNLQLNSNVNDNNIQNVNINQNYNKMDNGDIIRNNSIYSNNNQIQRNNSLFSNNSQIQRTNSQNYNKNEIIQNNDLTSNNKYILNENEINENNINNNNTFIQNSRIIGNNNILPNNNIIQSNNYQYNNQNNGNIQIDRNMSNIDKLGQNEPEYEDEDEENNNNNQDNTLYQNQRINQNNELDNEETEPKNEYDFIFKPDIPKQKKILELAKKPQFSKKAKNLEILPNKDVRYEEKPKFNKDIIKQEKVITKKNKQIEKTIVRKPIVHTTISPKRYIQTVSPEKTNIIYSPTRYSPTKENPVKYDIFFNNIKIIKNPNDINNSFIYDKNSIDINNNVNNNINNSFINDSNFNNDNNKIININTNNSEINNQNSPNNILQNKDIHESQKLIKDTQNQYNSPKKDYINKTSQNWEYHTPIKTYYRNNKDISPIKTCQTFFKYNNEFFNNISQRNKFSPINDERNHNNEYNQNNTNKLIIPNTNKERNNSKIFSSLNGISSNYEASINSIPNVQYNNNSKPTNKQFKLNYNDQNGLNPIHRAKSYNYDDTSKIFPFKNNNNNKFQNNSSFMMEKEPISPILEVDYLNTNPNFKKNNPIYNVDSIRSLYSHKSNITNSGSLKSGFDKFGNPIYNDIQKNKTNLSPYESFITSQTSNIINNSTQKNKDVNQNVISEYTGFSQNINIEGKDNMNLNYGNNYKEKGFKNEIMNRCDEYKPKSEIPYKHYNNNGINFSNN